MQAAHAAGKGHAHANSLEEETMMELQRTRDALKEQTLSASALHAAYARLEEEKNYIEHEKKFLEDRLEQEMIAGDRLRREKQKREQLGAGQMPLMSLSERFRLMRVETQNSTPPHQRKTSVEDTPCPQPRTPPETESSSGSSSKSSKEGKEDKKKLKTKLNPKAFNVEVIEFGGGEESRNTKQSEDSDSKSTGERKFTT